MKGIWSQKEMELVLKSNVKIPISVEEKLQNTYRSLGLIDESESFSLNDNNSMTYYDVSQF
ncbi:hypothetical protein H6B07_18855 [Mediterraneibacter glycyrrhizinilyticus]|nr:hypothetical protein [Mediterraneibacter glycyrrhizinilyticus]MBM6804646.1 hypothetical protein [Mediterraneibacter glycyrrhizinilyticus]